MDRTGQSIIAAASTDSLVEIGAGKGRPGEVRLGELAFVFGNGCGSRHGRFLFLTPKGSDRVVHVVQRNGHPKKAICVVDHGNCKESALHLPPPVVTITEEQKEAASISLFPNFRSRFVRAKWHPRRLDPAHGFA